MNTRSTLWPVAALALVTGCANVPRAPSELDLKSARISVSAVDAGPRAPAASGKLAGAAGGAIGMGAYAGISAGLPCIFLGPFAAPCFAAVLPTVGVAAAAGGVLGAALADNPEQAAAKQKLLEEAPVQFALQERLLTQVQSKARERFGVELLRAEADTSGTPASWIMAIRITRVAASEMEIGAAYALQASASLAIMRAGETTSLFSKEYKAHSGKKMTTEQWSAGGAEPVRAALDDLMSMLAHQMVSDLARG